MPRKSSDVVDVPAGIPPEVVKRIAEENAATKAARRPLCPMCGRRPQETAEGFCVTCSRDRHERDKERKRRWWGKHADAKRMAARSLDEISSDIRESFDLGREGYEQAVDAYLAIGRDLLQAREEFPADRDYGRWFRAQHFPFKQPWAWTLREAARNEAEVRAVISQRMTEGIKPNIQRALQAVRQSDDDDADDEHVCDDPTCRHCPIHCEASA